jgi:gas vesicle protein
MGQDPDAIRQQIEETRSRMDDTVGALGYKADVPSRTKEAVGEKVGAVTGKVQSVKESITGSASDAAGTVGDKTPSAGDVKQAARKGAGIAQENPLGLAVGSIAIGFLAGMLIPTTNVENQKLGPIADQAKEQVKQTGQEALEHGKQVAQDVASTAQDSVQQVKEDVKSTAQQSAQEHGQQVAETAQDRGDRVRQEVSSS